MALTILPSALGEQLHVVLLVCSRRWRGFYARHREPLLLISWALDVRSLVALSECTTGCIQCMHACGLLAGCGAGT